MRNALKPAALLLLCSLGVAPVFAQSGKEAKKNTSKQETVVIKKGPGEGTTIIEIKDGTVYVNGEAIVTVHDAEAANIHKKVIIEDGKDGDIKSFYFDNGDNTHGQRKAMLGVMTDPTSEKVGALVKDVTPGSAAEKAGLQSGDVITRVDGKAIKDPQMLVMEIMAQHDAGDVVTINYERNGKQQTTQAKLMPVDPKIGMRHFRFDPEDGDMPNMMLRGFPFAAGVDMNETPKLGVSAEDRADGEGVRVLGVKPGSAAASAGIKEGDVVTRLDREKVGSVDELQMKLRSMKGGDKVQLEYQRAGKLTTTDVLLPKAVKRKDL